MSGRRWTPYELDVILHHALSLAPFDRADAPSRTIKAPPGGFKFARG